MSQLRACEFSIAFPPRGFTEEAADGVDLADEVGHLHCVVCNSVFLLGRRSCFTSERLIKSEKLQACAQ